MKKIIITAMVGVCLLTPTGVKLTPAKAEEIKDYKSIYLCDATSGIVAEEYQATKRLPIASMCKIMTLLLSFEEVDKGNLCYDEQICISEKASGMGGSQVYLQTGLSYSAEELLKTIAVCSANDSCVAMAERISGSEDAFVDKMNERARQLGAENTLFANCTGLPKEPQYSCAKDVAIMLKQLISHEKYFEFSKVWLEDFAHPDGRTTRITNTNKLTRFYEGCDGGKTGFTSQAGFCLAATAKRGDLRLISVVIGVESSQKRFERVSNLFNEGFAQYESKVVARANEPLKEKMPVRGCKEKEIYIYPSQTLSVFQKKGESTSYHVEYLFDEKRAPVEKGERVGQAVLYREGVEILRCELLSAEQVEKLSWKDAFHQSARLWN